MNMLPYSGFPALPDKMEDMYKQLVALGLNDVEALTARIKKCEDWVDNVEETELTGNPVEFQNALAVPAKSLVTEINAIQDLHGYDKPWAGGAGKNKLPLTTDNIKSANGGASSWTGNKKTISGSEVEILEDADGNTVGIKITNTPNATLIVNLYTFASGALSGNYALNGCPTNGGDSTYNITLFDGTTALRDKGSGVSFASSDFASAVQCFIRIQSGYAIPSGGLIFKPMIRLSTESDASFAPYSNICPISGRDSVVVTRSDGDEISEDFTIQLGTTVYGADINWDTGVMTVKTALVDNGTLTWVEQETAVSNKKRFYAILSPSAVAATSVALTSKSSQYSLLPQGGTYPATADGYTITDDDRLYIYDEAYSSATTEEFKTAMSGVQVEYTLDTPTTIQLTPTQLQMLKGYNRVSIEDGTITITAYTGGPWEPITRTIKKVTNKTKKRRK